MSALWTSAEIETATGGVVSGPFAATGVAFDSREVGPGDLFIALKGETTDGHRFVDGAFEQGAAGAIVFAAAHFALGPRRTRQTVAGVLALVRRRSAG